MPPPQGRAEKIEGGQEQDPDEGRPYLESELMQRHPEDLDGRRRQIKLEGLPPGVAREKDPMFPAQDVPHVEELLGVVAVHIQGEVPEVPVAEADPKP
jgi:hypothetical protein